MFAENVLFEESCQMLPQGCCLAIAEIPRPILKIIGIPIAVAHFEHQRELLEASNYTRLLKDTRKLY